MEMFVMGNIWKGIYGGKSGFRKIYGLPGYTRKTRHVHDFYTLLHWNRDVDNMKAESWNGFCKKLPCQCITMQCNAIHYNCNLGAAIFPPNFFTLNILESK